jgi:DNA repair exonuclease SbcCD nuclease subunit
MSKTHRVVILTDIHLRSDYVPKFLDTQVKTLKKLVNTKPPDSVVIAGDIFHKRNPGGEELLAFGKLLDGLKCNDIYVLRGNHDTIHKDGRSASTLSLFADKAKIIIDTETIKIGSVVFDFIPHYEDEEKIIREVKKSKNHIFGHFGFDGCVSNGSYTLEGKLKKWHFPKKKKVFLGHIHKPKTYDNIRIMGTAYSNTFGEANTQKYVTELFLRDGEMEILHKPINFGIRHIQCGIDELPSKAKRLKDDNFFTLLRVSLDRLDEYVERQLQEKIIADYKVAHLEVVFQDVLPKFTSSYTPDAKLISLDDSVINEYLDSRDSVFSKEDLLETLHKIRDEDK